MAKLYNLARMSTATTGTGTLTLGSPISGFLSFAAAGVADGETITYAISDGANSEISKGVYTASGTTLTRVAAGMKSTNSNAAINLSGTAQVFITPRAEDIPKGDGRIYGLTLSNNATDAVNDIDIATGLAGDSADGIPMQLLSGLTKRLDAAWTVGTNQGGLDTGSIANTTYHMFLIQRSDTGVVDVLFSTSPTAPTMPTNYDRKRRIGAILRISASIRAFYQYGDVFKLALANTDYTATSSQADELLALTVPTGIVVVPMLDAFIQMNAAGRCIFLVGDGNNSVANYAVARTANTSECSIGNTQNFVTNTAAQIRFSVVLDLSGTLTASSLKTHGWIDGRDK